MAPATGKGITKVPSSHSCRADRREAEKHSANQGSVTLFALVDHSGEAKKAGLEMPAHEAAHFRQP